MSEGRFYWLKLRRDFFKRHDVRILETAPGGRDALLVLLKLMAESVDHDGALRYSERMAYTPAMLATVINETPDAVEGALTLLEEFGFLDTDSAGTIRLTHVPGMIGSAADNDNANRQRRFREKQKGEALRNVTESVTKNNERQSKRKSKSKRTETETDQQGVRRACVRAREEKTAVPPSVTEVNRYCDENGLSIDGEAFVEFFDAKDWTDETGEPVRNWKALLRSWERYRMEGGHHGETSAD